MNRTRMARTAEILRLQTLIGLHTHRSIYIHTHKPHTSNFKVKTLRLQTLRAMNTYQSIYIHTYDLQTHQTLKAKILRPQT